MHKSNLGTFGSVHLCRLEPEIRRSIEPDAELLGGVIDLHAADLNSRNDQRDR